MLKENINKLDRELKESFDSVSINDFEEKSKFYFDIIAEKNIDKKNSVKDKEKEKDNSLNLNFNVSLEDMNSIDVGLIMCDTVLEFINEKYLLNVNYNYMLALCLNVKVFFETVKYILILTRSRL